MVEPDHFLTVQVCYATPDVQWRHSISVTDGSTVEQGIRMSGLLDCGFDIDLATVKVGIFGKLKSPDTVLRDGDRIELYRPLIADPKDSRRKRAEKKNLSDRLV